MHDWWRSIDGFLRERVNWHRVGVVLGLSITVIALYVLYKLLRGIDPREVLDAIRQTSALNIFIAALFVAAGYITLTFYDYFALRTIGRDEVPYRTAAIAGFTSYSIGHNVGFSIFSGGTVRFRIYSTASGLSAVEVAKICFIAGLTFWLGNIAVLGLGFIIHPEAAAAVDRLPPAVNYAAGVMLLALLAAYTIWVSIADRKFGRGGWSVTLPGGRLTLLQISIGVIDLACCAAAMYMLMPAEPPIDFISLAVIFIAATLLGFASHTPGGIGVFDATMLIALAQFNREELVGALLLFRLLYYIIPFALSLAIVAYREFVMKPRRIVTKPRRRPSTAA
ncbi:MAG TPA: lysylphosphatidylglycerol synthase domain-containing protein [Xanthobacteraceae bacterium]|nr:lysylphosphatidylglycerol synthase domain-containing protein [Xanthobacteraceae bacterium]